MAVQQKTYFVNKKIYTMFLTLKLLLGFCLIGASYAKSEAEIKNYFIGLGVQCNIESPITPEDMLTLHQHKIPDNENAKCLLACVYKKAAWMDGKGMLDVATTKSLIEKTHLDDATKAENSKKLFDLCAKVNDETVKDGEKGCERAALLTTCLTENAPKMGLQLLI